MKATFTKSYLPILIVIVLFAGYLRVYNLGVPSFWVDELDFVEAAKAQSTVGEPLLPSGYRYERTPLLTRALVFSYKLLGVSELSTRLPSAIFGILTIILLFHIGRSWFDSQVGLIAALFAACMPFEIGWSRTARMYALFQLTFLAGMYLFYRGFEKSANESREENGTASGIKAFLRHWLLDWRYLLAGGIVLALSYTSHQNAALFLPSTGIYIVIMFFVVGLRDGWSTSLSSKYGTLTALMAVGIVLAVAWHPAREFLSYALNYQPKWAEMGSAQDRWRIFRFMSDSMHFPLYLFFLIGVLQIVRRCHKAGLYALVNLIIPVLLFSFVFSYRKTDYIYHVYPVLFLVAALPLGEVVRLLFSKFMKMRHRPAIAMLDRRNLLQPAVLLLCLVWFPATTGFRFGQKIPRLPDGSFNGAVSHSEWREAAEFVRSKLVATDAVMSTLPLSVRYYLGRADYNLNWSNSDLARVKHFVASDGRFIDFYSGADLIENLAELKETLRRQPRGWLLVDNYRFASPVYVPTDVQRYVLDTMKRAFATENKTVTVFRWDATGQTPPTH